MSECCNVTVKGAACCERPADAAGARECTITITVKCGAECCPPAQDEAKK